MNIIGIAVLFIRAQCVAASAMVNMKSIMGKVREIQQHFNENPKHI